MTLVLTVVFAALKVTGEISWPWLWVLAPLWMEAAFWCVIVAAAAFSSWRR